MNSKKQQRGFTLMELICVTIIISLLLVLGVLNLDYLLPKYRLRSAAREIGQLLKTARATASTAGKDVYVQFNFEDRSAKILAPFEKEDEFGQTSVYKKVRYEGTLEVVLPQGVQLVNIITGEDRYITSSTFLIRLLPTGISTTVIVNLQNEVGEQAAVELNGITGALSFYEHHRDAESMLEDFE